jgi:hypothetical protein
MSGDISNTGGSLVDGTNQAMGGLPASKKGKASGPGVDPRLSAAVDDTSKQNQRGRQNVVDAGDKTSKYTKGLSDIQDDSARGIKSAGNGQSSMPAMPMVPASSAPTAPAPMQTPAPAPAMTAPAVTPPAGVSSIDPNLLAALIEASRAQSDGDTPRLSGDPASASSATTPQSPQPLDVSQVSLEKYPGGKMSADQTASIIDQALTINGIPNDPALRSQWQELYQHMAVGESSRNPNAANNSDTNATGSMLEDGAYANSSRGMWQCIPSTFAAYHMAGTSNSIYDPVASAAASINYVMSTYHVSPEGSGLTQFAAARGVGTGGYTGY